MGIKAPYYPVIYVRGYAATISEMEETVATPYMGFNLGSTKVRQNYDDEIVRFIFESPLIRLMKDEKYTDAYDSGDFRPVDEAVEPRSVWIYRYYEKAGGAGGEAERQEIVDFARGLREFILRVRKQVCMGDAAEEAKFKVYLVAHSMGGLVCRTYLQNICRHEDHPHVAIGEHFVDKVFTYATPHDGIEIGGFNAPDLGRLDGIHLRNFNRAYMRKYLKISDDNVPVSSLDGAFPEERFFSFVGTNYKDYDAFFGLSKKGTGPTSDGLVMMANAAARNTPRAFAHRSHSGHYGIVNSEEGYQNLRRFLFGDVRVDIWLEVDEITLPIPVQEQKDAGKEIRANYNIDVDAKTRNSGCFLTERRASQESAIRCGYDEMVKRGKPVYLFSGYLLGGKKAKGSGVRDTALAFAVRIGIEVPVFEVNERWWFDQHFEGERLLDETVTFEVRPSSDKTTVKYGLASKVGVGRATTSAEDLDPAEGQFEMVVPIGFKEGTANPPCPGFRGRIRLRARPWNA